MVEPFSFPTLAVWLTADSCDGHLDGTIPTARKSSAKIPNRDTTRLPNAYESAYVHGGAFWRGHSQAVQVQAR